MYPYVAQPISASVAHLTLGVMYHLGSSVGVQSNVQMRGRAASSVAAVCGMSGGMASMSGSGGFAGHTRGALECRQLVIDVHIAHFVLATQYNVWSNAT